MAATGHELLDASGLPEQSTINHNVRRWLTANVDVLRAQSGLAVVRQGAQTRVLGMLPDGHATQSQLTRAAVMALDNGVSFERNQSPSDTSALVGIRIRLAGRPGAVAFHLPIDSSASDDEIVQSIRSRVLRRVEDSAPPVVTQITPGEGSSLEQVPTRDALDRKELHARLKEQGVALDVLAAMLDQVTLEKSSRAMVDAISRHFGCQRVALGAQHGRRTRLDAVSGSADFDSRSSLAADLIEALSETLERERSIQYSHVMPPRVPAPAHARLATSSHVGNVVSLPLVDADSVVGALVLERNTAFDEQELEQLRALVLLSGPVIALHRNKARGAGRRTADAVRKAAGRCIGLDHITGKLIALCVVGFLVWATNATRVLHITADASIEATVQRAIVAGSNSYLAQVEKRAGDVVYRGDVLARLDVEDLQLERIKWEGERDKLIKEQRATMAQRDRTRVRILSAKRTQAQTQIDYLDAQISRAVLRTPIDGVVISGDLTEALGSPVERGQVLYEVASLSSYRLVLMIDEADVGEIDEGYQGRLRLRSRPHETYEFLVTGITPVSQSGDGSNQFRLEAQLVNAPSQLRPGMGGVAKIDAGEKAIGWIWTRSFINWARLQIWKLGAI